MRKILHLFLPIIVIGLCACGSPGANQNQSQNDSQNLNADITNSGWVEKNEIWQGEILITGDVFIPSGVTVTVQPGTTIRSSAQSDDQQKPGQNDRTDESTEDIPLISIVVSGTLDALGTKDAPILFTSSSQSPTNLDWQGIMIEGDGSVSLEYVTVEYSQFGLQLVSGTLGLSVSHAVFRDIKICAICGDGASPLGGEIEISFSSFIRCDREAIDTYVDQPIVVHNNIFSENHVAIMSVGSSILIENNLFINNERGIGVVDGGSPFISGNEFSKTQSAAIFVTNSSPSISNNNFGENQFNLQLEGSTQNLSAQNNWWGSSDNNDISESIFDGNDDLNLGIVNFQPFATQPFDLEIPEYEDNS